MADVQQQLRDLAARTRQDLLAARQRAVDDVEIDTPGDVLGAVVLAEMLERFDTAMDDFYTWLDEAIDYLGMPDELQLAASSWIENLAGTVSSLAQNVEAGDLLVDDRWTGTAAERYRQHVPDQLDALSSVREEFALPLSGTLNTVKDGVVTFQLALAAALVALAIAVIGAATLGIALGALLAAGVAGYIAVVTLNNALATADSSLRGVLTTFFQRWPAFAAE